jgi:hypothetical protein
MQSPFLSHLSYDGPASGRGGGVEISRWMSKSVIRSSLRGQIEITATKGVTRDRFGKVVTGMIHGD